MADQKIEPWLEDALANEEWVSTQKAAWERWSTPEAFGDAPPRFLLLSKENPELVLDQLATHFSQLARRHQEVSQELEQIRRSFLDRSCPAEPPQQEQSFS